MIYDVILGNPLYREAIQSGTRGFQLGLLYISTYVKEKGYKPKIVVSERVASEIIELISCNNGVPLVGLYVSADNVQEVERICLSLKNEFYDLAIILGGPEAKADHTRLLEQGITDYVCIGDGEECLLRLLEHLKDKQIKLEDIPTLAYLSKDKIVKKTTSTVVHNLDKYPIPDRSMYKKSFLNPTHISTTRGCIGKCTFCFEAIDRKVKRHSVERIIDEMKYLSRDFNVQYFSFIDDTFTTDKKRVYELCKRIEEAFTPFENAIWYCEARVNDIVKSPDLIQRMVQSGLSRMQFGSESGNQNVLDSYKKGISIDQIYKTVELASKTNLTSMFTNMIIGGAHETNFSFNKTLDMAKDLIKSNPGVVECSSTFLSPYLGTDVRNNPDSYGIDIIDKNFTTASSDSYIFAKSSNISQDQVLEMGRTFSNEVKSLMLGLVPSLEIAKIKKQIEVSKFGLTTTWYSMLTSDPIIKNWETMFFNGYYESCDLLDNEYLFIPSRTFNLESMIDSTIEWDIRGLKSKFTHFEMFLVERASGKLSVRDIIDSAYYSYWSMKVERNVLKKDIITFFNQLADNMLLMYRRFS